MKNRQITFVLLVMVLISSLCMAIACTTEDEVKVAITNKDALTATWTEDGADRQIQLEITVNGEVVTDKEYEVTSSDSNVISVGEDKLTLSVKGIGTATITAAVGEAQDSVEITVSPALKTVSVTNKEDLTKDWTDWTKQRTIQVAFAPAEHFTAENTTATVTVSPENIIKVEGYKLTPIGIGEATVTVAVGEVKDTFTVNVQRTVPKIEFQEVPDFELTDEGGKITAVEGTAVKIPEFTAKGCDGELIAEENVTIIPEENEKLTYNEADGTISATKGTYTVTIEVTDPIDAGKKARAVITFEFCRKLTFWTDTKWNADELKAENEQTLATTGDGYQMLSFNMDPSEYYYAEVNYVGASSSWIGMAHFKTETLQDEEGKDYLKENHKRVLIHALNTWSFDYQSIDYNTQASGTWTEGEGDNKQTVTKSGWEMLGQEWHDLDFGTSYLFHHYKLPQHRNFTFSADAPAQKFAVLRMGDYFMFFFNDQYVNTVDLSFYADGKTRPGIFVCANGNPGNIGTIKNINFFGGEEDVVAKYNALTDNGAKLIVNYVPDSWATASQNKNNDHFTLGETTTEKGINFTNTGKAYYGNASMISTYQLFDGNFSFSWVYKQTDNTNDGEPRMALEVRNFKWGDERTVFGAQYGGTGARWLLNTPKAPNGSQWYEGQNDFDITKAIRFTITRNLTETASEYTMTISFVDDPSISMTRTISVTAADDDRWNKPVIMHWKTAGVDGEFSNVMWKNRNGQGNWVD